MFSADTTLHGLTGHSSKNPRRRQRATGEEYTGAAGQIPPKRRKRSSISATTFDAPTFSKANGSAIKQSNDYGARTNGARDATPELEYALETHQNGTADNSTSLAVRSKSGKLNRERKLARHDEGLLLAKNDRYQVSKDFHLPDEVQDVIRAKDPWQARFSQDLGFVVLTTHHKAVVWKYSAGSTDTSKTMTINFANVTPKPKDSLPLGALVKDLGTGETALLVVSTGGNVTYWDSVRSAANTDVIRPKQSGLRGIVLRLLSAEQIVDIVEAEPEGFVFTTSVGRVLHLSVRDTQGKPAIVTEILRSSSPSGGGLLGGLKGFLTLAGWRRDVAAVKCTAAKSKGHRNCLVVTKQGLIQVWSLARQSTKLLQTEIESKELILSSCRPMDGPVGDVQVLDFDFLPSKKQNDNLHHLLLLVAVQVSNRWSYSLLEMVLQRDELEVKSVYPLSYWTHPPQEDDAHPTTRTTLLVPDPGHTAIITFGNAIMVASLSHGHTNPDSQLQNEIEPKADAFQDIMYFAKDRDFHLLGCTAESAGLSGTASCLFFVNDFGLAHLTVNKFKEMESVELRRANQCKTKIEQVVFFGDAPNKLFDFQRAMEVSDWSTQEIESAALEVNSAIMSSESSYIPTAAPSMDHQLKDRSTNLRSLIKFISKWKISADLRWHLLWSAEKMASARAIYLVYSEHLSKRDQQTVMFRGRNTVLLWEALDAVSEDYKQEIDRNKGENDIVRQFLTRDVDRLEILTAGSANAIEVLAEDGISSITHQAWMISQACDIVKASSDTAYKFRENNVGLYGFAPELFEDGIYRGENKGLPEPWTSSKETCFTIGNLAGYAQQAAATLSSPEIADEDVPEADAETLVKLIEDAATMARVVCQTFNEHCLYQTQNDPTFTTDAATEQRRALLLGLVDLLVPDDGLQLAEKYRDLTALAKIICQSKRFILDRQAEGLEEERVSLEQKLDDYEQRINKYFRDYGMTWAQAFYSELMAREGVTDVLKNGGQMLPEFLEKNPSLAKAKWMNDVGSARKYGEATSNLLKCNAGETNLWNKRVQLSLAKLSLLAAEEKGEIEKKDASIQTRHADRRLTTIEIQDLLYDYIRSHIDSAVDQEAGIMLAMEAFGINVKDTEIEKAVFKESVGQLILRRWAGEERLIDLLTLLYCPEEVLDDARFTEHRFFFALQTLHDSPHYEDIARTSLVQKLIWRRCIIQDDWSTFNITELKSDQEVAQEAESTALFKTLLAGFHDGLLESDMPPPQALSSLLGAGTTPEELRAISRWSNSPEAVVKATANDFAAEDEKLRHVLEQGRLEAWWQGLISAAKTELRTRLDDAAAMGIREAQLSRDVEGRLRAGVNGVNGHVDDEGDVVMD